LEGGTVRNDCEGNITEIYKILRSHDEEFTNLRIITGHTNDVIEKILEGPVRFHTQATQDHITVWPPNSVITFDSELVDSHSSMNHPQGIFTAPITGTYQFSFHADILTSETAAIFVYHNDKIVKKFQFFASNLNDKEILQRSIHFGLTLSQGDSVKLANGPDAHSLLALHNPIQFIGVLVNKT
jgi:hypothetical protein